MLEHLDTYDAMDQVEILCARRMLRRGPQSLLDDLNKSIQAKLARLPVAIGDQLARLGMLC